MRTLPMIIGMTVLCVYSSAQEEEAGTRAGKFSEESFRMLAEETKANVLAGGSAEERYKLTEDNFVKFERESSRIFRDSNDGYYKKTGEYIKAQMLIYDVFSEIFCETLGEEHVDSGTLDSVMSHFYTMARYNRSSPGHPQALHWARRVVKEGRGGADCAKGYLARKGGAQDMDMLSGYDREMLQARVAGTNVLDFTPIMPGAYWPGCVPSVTNMGPQGIYVAEILHQCWEDLEVVEDSLGNLLRDETKIPPELLTLVVWFDDGGNPVCNVDLAKYGLTMPEIDMPNRPKGKAGMRDEESGIESKKSRMRRLLPYALIIPAALAALLLARRRRR